MSVPVETGFAGFNSDFTVSAVTAFPGFRGVMPVFSTDCAVGCESGSPEVTFDMFGAVDGGWVVALPVEGRGANIVAEGAVVVAAPIVGASAEALADANKLNSKKSPHQKKTDLFIMKLPRGNRV